MAETAAVRLSVIITVFSETDSLAETIDRLLVGDRGHIHEILLLVSPRSSTPCLSLCRRLEKTHPPVRVLIQKNNPGVGRAVREGFAAATGSHIGLMSADLETEPEAIARMVHAVEAGGYDLVIASRWLPGGGFENYNTIKLVLNRLFQNIFKRLYRTGLGDLTFGLKIINKETADAIDWEAVHHEIFIETTLKPLLAGVSTGQVATVWKGRREGVSTNSFFINLRYVLLALKLSPKIFLGRNRYVGTTPPGRKSSRST